MAGDTPTQKLCAWLSDFGRALDGADVTAATELFGDNCFWRDLLSFTWNIITLEGKEPIAEMLTATLPEARPGGWLLEGDAIEADGAVEGWFTFETSASRGKGHVRLKGGRCWTLFTCMLELKGFEEKSGPTREKGAEHGGVPGRKSWSQVEAEEKAALGVTRQPYCVIVGGGQAGIGLGARLKRLGVPMIIVGSE